jgi:hypothetical protein
MSDEYSLYEKMGVDVKVTEKSPEAYGSKRVGGFFQLELSVKFLAEQKNSACDLAEAMLKWLRSQPVKPLQRYEELEEEVDDEEDFGD